MKQFEDKDLVLMAQIIDAATQKGVFKAPDLQIIGEFYNKIVAQLPKQEVKKEDEQK